MKSINFLKQKGIDVDKSLEIFGDIEIDCLFRERRVIFDGTLGTAVPSNGAATNRSFPLVPFFANPIKLFVGSWCNF